MNLEQYNVHIVDTLTIYVIPQYNEDENKIHYFEFLTVSDLLIS